MRFSSLTLRSLAVPAVLAMAAPSVHADWGKAAGFELDLESTETLTLSVSSFTTEEPDGEHPLAEGRLAVERAPLDGAGDAVRTELRDPYAREPLPGAPATVSGLDLKLKEKVRILVLNPNRVPELRVKIDLGIWNLSGLVEIECVVDADGNARVTRSKAGFPWRPFEFAISDQGVRVRQVPQAPGVMEKARDAAIIRAGAEMIAGFWKEVLRTDLASATEEHKHPATDDSDED